jgi:glycosyltransferase involved in cell wall biosynthesis
VTPFIITAGDFTPLGGMDRANHALASFLLRQGHEVALVTHRAWPDLRAAGARVVGVRRPLGSHLLGAPLLAAAGQREARGAAAGTRVVANGGNADTGDIVWVHYLHAAHVSPAVGTWLRRARMTRANAFYLARERAVLPRARVVICNSRRTARDIQIAYNLPIDRLRVVYYGSDPATFSPVTPEQRALARRALGWGPQRVALFVGTLGDHRKGFDRLFDAWCILSRDKAWDVGLAVAGAGAQLGDWQTRAAREGLKNVRFLGFREDIAPVMAACDVLVHPARYEAYGLAVHEALCRSIPAIVARDAGVAEMYPPDLHSLLIEDVESADEIAERLTRWRTAGPVLDSRVATLSSKLRARTWDEMAYEFVERLS